LAESIKSVEARPTVARTSDPDARATDDPAVDKQRSPEQISAAKAAWRARAAWKTLGGAAAKAATRCAADSAAGRAPEEAAAAKDAWKRLAWAAEKAAATFAADKISDRPTEKTGAATPPAATRLTAVDSAADAWTGADRSPEEDAAAKAAWNALSAWRTLETEVDRTALGGEATGRSREELAAVGAAWEALAVAAGKAAAHTAAMETGERSLEECAIAKAAWQALAAEADRAADASRAQAAALRLAAAPHAAQGAQSGEARLPDVARSAPAETVVHPARIDERAARKAAPKRRHQLAMASFALAVVLPTLASVGYLYAFAADQYSSRVAFSVRSAESSGAIEVLGALTKSLGGSIGPDAEIIYEYIRSQAMVESAMGALPVEAIFNRAEDDVVFRLGNGQPIEDITWYWNWMNDVSFDASTGIVEFEVRSFDPDSARRIAAFVLDESTRLVNELSIAARNDAVQIARQVVVEAEDRLREARRKVRAFRDAAQQVDPTEDARVAMGLVAGLEGELATAEVELDAQLRLVGERSPRLAVLRQRIASIKARIAQERDSLGAGTDREAGAETFSSRLAEYEELAVDREFAEKAYLSALAAYEQAQIETRRQMRYLAAHINPTLSIEPQYPTRWLIALSIFLLLSVTWSVLLLIAYNVRDRS
jgi:capsular polysaccharide transport system permease protein